MQKPKISRCFFLHLKNGGFFVLRNLPQNPPELRSFRCFSHTSAIARTGLQIKIRPHKMLEIKGFSSIRLLRS